MSESVRKCGSRKILGLYMVCDNQLRFECKQLPYIIERCPSCGGGIKFGRGLEKIIPKKLFERAQDCQCVINKICPFKTDTIALLGWVGEQFYTPQSFTEEAGRLGVSKRISAVPRGLQLGKTWIFLGHPKAGFKDSHSIPAVFYLFKPSRIEKIVTEADFKDNEKMDILRKQGITPVAVQDTEEHRGTAYDKPKEKTTQSKINETVEI
jgi:hypothetical protein